MPIQWDDIQIQDATEEQFAAIPSGKSSKQPDPRVVAILDDVDAGGIKEIRVPDESQMRGMRITLGRAAAQRGFKLDYRSDGPLMYIRKSDEPVKPKSPKQVGEEGNGRRGPGRPRKVQSTSAELLSKGMSETME